MTSDTVGHARTRCSCGRLARGGVLYGGPNGDRGIGFCCMSKGQRELSGLENVEDEVEPVDTTPIAHDALDTGRRGGPRHE
jgi:hypothetical protein